MQRKPSAVAYGIGALSLCLVAAGAAASTPDLVVDAALHPKQSTAEGAANPGVATPADRDRRLAEKNLTLGSPVLIRIFKAEAELELWMQKDGRFVRFATYPICYWSGTLGPKLKEGDRQSPEGIYAIVPDQINRRQMKRAFDIGYPSAVDRASGRTGTGILLHGGCQSIGCYAMTNSVMDEIFVVGEQAFLQGQQQIPVHVFPFRMTDANLAAYATHPWQKFWASLKEAHDIFERTHVLPTVAVCGRQYRFGDGSLSGGAAVADAPAADAQECGPEDPQPTLEEIAAARKLTPVATRAQEIAAIPVAVRQVSNQRSVAPRTVRQNYAAARQARVATFARQAAYSARARAH